MSVGGGGRVVLGGYLTPLEKEGTWLWHEREGVISGRLSTRNTVMVSQRLSMDSYALRLDFKNA